MITFDQATVDSSGAFLIGELERLDQTLNLPLVGYRDIKVQAITIEKAVWFFFRLCCFNLLNSEHG